MLNTTMRGNVGHARKLDALRSLDQWTQAFPNSRQKRCALICSCNGVSGPKPGTCLRWALGKPHTWPSQSRNRSPTRPLSTALFSHPGSGSQAKISTPFASPNLPHSEPDRGPGVLFFVLGAWESNAKKARHPPVAVLFETCWVDSHGFRHPGVLPVARGVAQSDNRSFGDSNSCHQRNIPMEFYWLRLSHFLNSTLSNLTSGSVRENDVSLPVHHPLVENIC